jgi:hypothetical protein
MSVATAVKYVCPGLGIVWILRRCLVKKLVLRVVVTWMLKVEVVFVETTPLVNAIVPAEQRNQKSLFNVTVQAVLSMLLQDLIMM